MPIDRSDYDHSHCFLHSTRHPYSSLPPPLRTLRTNTSVCIPSNVCLPISMCVRAIPYSAQRWHDKAIPCACCPLCTGVRVPRLTLYINLHYTTPHHIMLLFFSLCFASPIPSSFCPFFLPLFAYARAASASIGPSPTPTPTPRPSLTPRLNPTLGRLAFPLNNHHHHHHEAASASWHQSSQGEQTLTMMMMMMEEKG